MYAYSCVVRLEEALLHTRPDGEGDDEQLVWVTHVIESGDKKLKV